MKRCMIVVLLLVLAHIFGTAPSWLLRSQALLPLEKMLKGDGTLNIQPGFTGSLDPTGYRMTTGQHGEPVFIKSPRSTMTVPADVAWNDRFGPAASFDQAIWTMTSNGSDLYVCGDFTEIDGIQVNHIARWDGAHWSSVGGGIPSKNHAVYGSGFMGSDLYVAGFFDTIGGVPARNVAKWDGFSWSPLGTGSKGIVQRLLIWQSNIYICGWIDSVGGVLVNGIAKWDGVSWSALGAGTDGYVKTMTASSTDLYIGGQFSMAGGLPANRIAKWNGTTWSALGTGVGTLSTDNIYSLQMLGSDLYVGGEFSIAGGLPASNIAKWNGSSWSALGSGTNTAVLSLTTDGLKIYAGGSFDSAGGAPASCIAMWNGSNWSPLGQGINGGEVVSLMFFGGSLYAGGYITGAGGQPAMSIAFWDGSAWHSFPGQDMDAPVFALATKGKNVYAGGLFHRGGQTPLSRIGVWNDTTWSDVGGGLDSTVYAIAVSGNDVYVGGAFVATLGGTVLLNHVAKWDGSSWSALGNGLIGTVRALAFSNGILYAGGEFPQSAVTVHMDHIAKWDGISWSALGDGLNNTVFALAVSDSGLFAGGGFTASDTISLPYFARWKDSTWSSPGGGMNGPVYALATRGSTLYAGGIFTLTGGGTTVHHIAQLSGNNWAPVGILGLNGLVFALAADSSKVVAGGEFNNADGVAVDNIALWNDTVWSPLGSGVNSMDMALTLRGIDIFTGGYFLRAGDKPSYFIGEWEGKKVIKIVTEDYPHGKGWNLISAPLGTNNNSVLSLFPTAISPAFSFQGLYVGQDMLTRGEGYWVKFGDTGSVSMTGYLFTADTIPVLEGWNLIGSLGQSFPASQISSIPPGIVTSELYGYHNGYFASPMVDPGNAYWVKANQPGELILSAGMGAAGVAGKIRIVPTSEMPPPPPDGAAGAGSTGPERFALEQNYPNPFNPTTVISYTVPTSGMVRLVVYNLLGQEVATLVNERQDAGQKTVSFNATNLPSGVYAYRLTAGTYSQVRKMTLVK